MHGSDVTITVYRACAQDFVGAWAQKAAHTIPNTGQLKAIGPPSGQSYRAHREVEAIGPPSGRAPSGREFVLLAQGPSGQLLSSDKWILKSFQEIYILMAEDPEIMQGITMIIAVDPHIILGT